jgi:hypothetical protein
MVRGVLKKGSGSTFEILIYQTTQVWSSRGTSHFNEGYNLIAGQVTPGLT